MEKLLEELFSKYHKEVYIYIYSLCHDASLSEDLTSDVFVEVIKSIGSFKGNSDIKTWIFSIARHKWFHYLRKKQRSVETELITEFLPSTDKTPDEIILNKQIIERIHILLNSESEKVKNIVLMRMEGYSFYEISIKFGISESSARVIDFRAKNKIKKILEKEGIGYD